MTKAKGIEHGRSMLIVCSVPCTLCNDSTQALLRLGWNMIVSIKQVGHITAEVTHHQLVYLCLLSVIRSMNIKIQGGNLRISPGHILLAVHNKIVPNHGQELQWVCLFTVEAHLYMQESVTSGHVITCLDILTEIADCFADMTVDNVVAASLTIRIVGIIDRQAKPILSITGYARYDTRSQGFQPSTTAYPEIHTMRETFFSSLLINMFAIVSGHFNGCILVCLKRHGIATWRIEIHCMLYIHNVENELLVGNNQDWSSWGKNTTVINGVRQPTRITQVWDVDDKTTIVITSDKAMEATRTVSSVC